MKFLVPLTISSLALFLCSCQTKHPRAKYSLNEAAELGLPHVKVIEVPSADSKAYIDQEIYETTTSVNSELRICRETQRAQLISDEITILDTPIATGVRAHPTPGGQFQIMSKKSMHRSSLYGNYVDEEGKVVKKGVDNRVAEQPEGTTFVGTAMPFWHRLTGDGVGLHVGYVPPRAASHGCVRFPKQIMPLIYAKTDVGTSVVIQ
jgi:hypothetical protein